MNIDYNKLKQSLKDDFTDYYKLLTVPIRGEIWENLLVRSLAKQSSNIEWDCGSHRVGTDIVFNGTNISCKSGQISGKKDPRLVISSHRTTSYSILEEKLKYLSEGHEDIFFCLNYKEDIFMNQKIHKYRLFVFESKDVDYNELSWEVTKSGWEGNGKFIAKIKKTMSDQLWLRFPLSMVNEIFDIEIQQESEYDNAKETVGSI